MQPDDVFRKLSWKQISVADITDVIDLILPEEITFSFQLPSQDNLLANSIRILTRLHPIYVSENPKKPGEYICVAGQRTLQLANQHIPDETILAGVLSSTSEDLEVLPKMDWFLTLFPFAVNYPKASLYRFWTSLEKSLRNRLSKTLSSGTRDWQRHLDCSYDQLTRYTRNRDKR